MNDTLRKIRTLADRYADLYYGVDNPSHTLKINLSERVYQSVLDDRIKISELKQRVAELQQSA